MDQACRIAGGQLNIFSCLLGNAVPNDDITVTSVKMPFTKEDKQWRCRLSACVQAGGGHFKHHF